MGRKVERFRVELEFDKFIKHGTFQMFHAVARSNQLTLQQKGVYSMLASYAFSLDQESWPSHQRLAEEAGVSSRYIGKIINQLVEFGLIRKRARHGDSNVYTLVFPDGELLAKLFPNGYTTGSSPDVQEGWNNSSREGGTIVPGGWNNSSTKEKEENKKENNTISEERKKEIEEVWEHWLKTFEGYYKRARLTEKKKQKINARLNDFSVEDLKRYMESIRESKYHMENGYYFIENIFREHDRVEKRLNMLDRQQPNKTETKRSESTGGGIYRNADEIIDHLFD